MNEDKRINHLNEGTSLTERAAEAFAAGAGALIPDKRNRNIPLADYVIRFANELAKNSKDTATTYLTGLGYFFEYFGDLHEAHFRAEGIYPLYETERQRRKKAGHIWRGPVGVIHGTVYAQTLAGFDQWLKTEVTFKARKKKGSTEMIDKNLAPATRRKYLQGVKTFLRMAFADDILSEHQETKLGLTPYDFTPKTNEQRVVGVRLSKSDVGKLLKGVYLLGNDRKQLLETKLVDGGAAERAKIQTIRDYTILLLFLQLGLRVGEMAVIRLNHFEWDQGRWRLLVQGKGNKIRPLPLRINVQKQIVTWLEELNKHTGIQLELGNSHTPLFFATERWGNLVLPQDHAAKVEDNYEPFALTRSAYQKIVERISTLALGIENSVSPHDLRRTAAWQAYQNGAEISYIQQFLGHAAITTTMLYLGIGAEKAGVVTENHLDYDLIEIDVDEF